MPRGGKRPGAGRKSDAFNIAARGFYSSIITSEEKAALFRKFLKSKNLKIALAALTYIIDRDEGKPAQSLKHSGPEGDDPIKVILYGGKTNGHAQT